MPEFTGQATLNELVGALVVKRTSGRSCFSLESSRPGRRRLVVVACIVHLPPADLGRISAHALLFSEGSLIIFLIVMSTDRKNCFLYLKKRDQAPLLAHKRTVPLHYLDTFIYLAASSLASLQTRKEKAKKKKKKN